MKNITLIYITLLASILIFTGCTYHLHHVHDRDTYIRYNPSLAKIDKKTCIYYDKDAFVKLDVYHSIRASDWAYDYGKGMKTLGERFFFQYDNIKFIDIGDSSFQNDSCDIDIFPKVDKITYTYYVDKSFYTDLDIEMGFNIHDLTVNKQYKIVKRSEGLKVYALWATELINMSNEIHKWVLPTLENVIIEANKNPEEKQ